jgi:ubiquinone/menaquinone biosynthesis C-methylase UbiE
MPQPMGSPTGAYSLATGEAAVRRLKVVHYVYAPAGRRVLWQAGLTSGMEVADFGCGVGVITRMLAEMPNVTFVEASAVVTTLPRQSLDLAYCRFLLLHLTDPAACLKEMYQVLKPGGIIVVLAPPMSQVWARKPH